MAFSAAAMYAGAAFLGMVQHIAPGGPAAPLAPALGALVLAPIVAFVGQYAPRNLLALLGPLGAVMIATSLAEADYAGDGAVLYMWPVVWTAHFYGRYYTAAVVAVVGVAHALALMALPAGLGNGDRWLDVVISTAVVACIVRLLTERHENQVARNHQEAREDALSGLANRRAFDESYPRAFTRADLDDQPITVVCFDIDHFKEVNDEHGHEYGDRVIELVGETLRCRARTLDLVARVGGEEFVAVLPGLDREDAVDFAERLRMAVERTAGVTLSAGVATSRRTGTPSALLAAADSALYAAKRAGRDRTEVGELSSADTPVAS